MLNCPVCRSQNMDTAKFCGNCGTPFPRSPVPSSSLVNCPQGHIYSAVYEHCPYCPQPEQPKSGDFATRVEGSETIVETASLKPTPSSSGGEFATRVETPTPVPEVTVIDAAVTSLEINGDEAIETRASSETRVEPIGQTETIIGQQAPVVPTPEPLRMVPPSPSKNAPPPTPAQSVPPPPPAPRPVRESHTADQPDRRTIVVASPADEPGVKGKGKIIGWLITYTRNQEGVDYRLRVGFNRIGAHPACDLVMDDETVSGSHAVVVFRDGRCLIKDELSRNGTFVNDVEVTEARVLQNYDQIRVGNTTLIFISAERPA